jgi:predicted O-methyltransferase YrrM
MGTETRRRQVNSLTTGPLAGVLDELLAAAAAQRRQSRREPRPGLPAPQPPDPGDFRAEFAGAERRYMAVSPETGRLLYLLSRTGGAQNVVEFGTSFGVSTLFLAAAVRDNGGGRVIGTEFEPTKVDATRASVTRAGVDDIVEIRAGDARATLASNLPTEIDFVLLDGAKPLYLELLELLEPHLKPGAVVVADNAHRAPDYQSYVRDHDTYVSTGLAELDLEISCRTR